MNNLNPTTLNILRGMTFEGNKAYLNQPQLPRQVYEDVNEVLVRLRGKWKGGRTKAHIFPFDPQPLVEAVIESKEMPSKNPTAFFVTQPEVIREMVDYADVRYLSNWHGLSGWDKARILEPSAGTGAIADVIIQEWPDANLDLVEIEPVNCRGNLGHGTAILVDGYLVGVFAYDQSFILGWKQGSVVGRLMIHYGMAVPNRSHRYNRLLTMVAMNHEAVHASLDDYYATRVEAVATVQQTQYPESKEMRGLMKLTDRKKHPRYGYKLTYQGEMDMEPLDTVFGRWLNREQHWLKARAKAKARSEKAHGKDS